MAKKSFKVEKLPENVALTLRVSEETKSSLKALATKNNITVNTLLNQMIEHCLKEAN